VESGMLVVTIVFGTLLIRSVLHEIRQRERLGQLTAELENAYRSMGINNDHPKGPLNTKIKLNG
jgi:hypothetical protein